MIISGTRAFMLRKGGSSDIKYFLFLLMTASCLISGCNVNDSSYENSEIARPVIETTEKTAVTKTQHATEPLEPETIEGVDCVGGWRKAPTDEQGFSEHYYFQENGTFSCLNNYALSRGKWTLKDNIITLETIPEDSETADAAAPSVQYFSVEATNCYDAPGLLLDGELYLNDEKQHLYYQAVSGNSMNAENFAGNWNRTDVVRACSANLDISEQTDSSFLFDILAFRAASTGEMKGTAYIIAPNQAFCYLYPVTEVRDSGFLLFTLIDDELIISYDGDLFALGFGHNVYADGVYTKGEPLYTNANIVDECLPTTEIREKMRSLVGDEVYEQIIFVMEYGFDYPSDEYTYSGFVSGDGLGVDFIIQNDGKIYCLLYDWGRYTLYTNDPVYKDKLPDFMKIPRDDYKLEVVYKDV